MTRFKLELIMITCLIIAVLYSVYRISMDHRPVVVTPETPQVKGRVLIWTREQLLERCTGKEIRYEECGSGVWRWCSEDKKTACQKVGP